MLANGLSSYLQTKNAMGERDQRKQQQAREQEQFDAWKQDRAAAQQSNADRQALYKQIPDATSSFLSTSTQTQGSTATNPGTTLPTSITHGGDGGFAQPQDAPQSGSNLGNGPTQSGVQALTDANAKLSRLQVEASRLQDRDAMDLINQQRQALLGRWASAYQGDTGTMQGALGYAQHIAQGAAALGNPLTPDQAFQYAKAKEAYDTQGVMKSLQFAHAGDKDAALKWYNANGDHKFADIQLTPAKSVSGVASYNITGINPDGSKEQLGNAFDNMTHMMMADEQLKAFNDRQRTENDTARTRASVAADYALANERNNKATSTGSGGLTVPQQRTNASIDSARQQLAGLTTDDIKQKTASFTATGRENTEYDPQIARLVKLANTRKYGDDQAFDQFTANRQKSTESASQTADPQRADAAKRFRADSAMSAYKLGNNIAGKGYEVLDNKGRVYGWFK